MDEIAIGAVPFVAAEAFTGGARRYVKFVDVAFSTWPGGVVACLAVCVSYAVFGHLDFVAHFDVVSVDAETVVFCCETHWYLVSLVPCVAVYSVG